MSTRCLFKLSSVIGLAVGLAEMVHAGPISPLYVSDGEKIQVFQGLGVIDSWLTGEQEFSIAVSSSVKTWSQGNPALSLLGREYLLDGTPTGTTYLNSVGCCFRDGTTDGTYNYAVRLLAGSQAIYRSNLDWTDPQIFPLEFPSLSAGLSGITYDSSDGTFWLATADTSFGSIVHITNDGKLISYFGAGAANVNVSLAYDRADDTLWLYIPRPLGGSELVQFATSDDMTHANFPLFRQPVSGFAYGIEFALQNDTTPVPEPATITLLGTAFAMMLGLGARRLHRRPDR